MKQVTDTGAIEKAVDEIIAANPDKVEQVKAKPTMLGWFVGQVMKATGGKANPQAVNEPRASSPLALCRRSDAAIVRRSPSRHALDACNRLKNKVSRRDDTCRATDAVRPARAGVVIARKYSGCCSARARRHGLRCVHRACGVFADARRMS
jgi:hypothetical protein